jgi:uncharacterized membrane protein (UPF0127 family)
MRRRELLAVIGAGSVGGVAGCAGLGPTASGNGDDGESDAETGGGAEAGGAETGGDEGASAEWPTGTYADYGTTTVTVSDSDGEAKGSVTAAVADTRDKRFLGLSDAESLTEDGGMLFVYDAPRESLTYVMREMDFGIDIVYADGEGEIVEIHNAPEPGPGEDGEEQRYPGSGQYVLEVPYEWTDRHDVEVGDSLQFEL